jgi:hypothetical protein
MPKKQTVGDELCVVPKEGRIPRFIRAPLLVLFVASPEATLRLTKKGTLFRVPFICLEYGLAWDRLT